MTNLEPDVVLHRSIKMWAEQFGMIDSCMFYVFCAAVFVIVLLALVDIFVGFCLHDLS